MKYFIRILLLLSVAGNVWFFYHETVSHSPTDYPLLSPRIFAEHQNDILVNFLPLRNSIRSMTSVYGNTFGLYFEYLPSGTSIGINEKDTFYAASLIKVPVVMAYYRQTEETGLSFNDAKITLNEQDIDQDFGALWQRGIGTQITYNEAVQLSLKNSDNTAALALANRIGQQYFDSVYAGLDIDFTKVDDKVIISTKQYASILKALYFSSVLTKSSSQAILTLLTQTNWNDKLPAGVPVGIPVAHKFGVYTEKNLYQDCGIVYVPKRPYVLCMMSQSSEDEAKARMTSLSRIIYEYVTNANHIRN